ncbi:TonB-dependent receptor [Acinetobacter qingfengensis]|uniref:TonB-dependent receptor n=1 Tax=Acinetobacter qingfengensis TaxID=1262585 RepID=A0A1E7RD20_9GAMM|nr:TonB-dependent receptor [Acinetobacter qingfengensis]KAA8732114.1 TonB-dependent receptor [Acinetobacter qingfengensis]OEY97193.1 TonB-dependent receptor [Acinetobacter qingfengensis]
MKFFEKKHLCISILSLMSAMTVYAADDDSIDVGTINVKGQSLGGGKMVVEDTPKGRSTVTQEALEKQPGIGNALDKIKNVPGLQMTSTDSTGISGLSYTMRGMDPSQIGLSADGIPVNDSGNYAVYPNLLGDSENLDSVFVTQGSSEADGPHIGSSGGNIGLTTKRPNKKAGGMVEQTFGSNGLSKSFVRLETGKIGNFSAWVSASNTEADKWKGEGDLKNRKFEMGALYEADNGNTSNLIVKYNKQDNYNYNTISKADYDADPNAYGTTGHKADFSTDPSASRYYKLARNPFENFTVSFTQKFILADNLNLSFQPYYYWGNGGSGTGQSYVLASNDKSLGNYDLTGFPTSSSAAVKYWRPSWTQTWRPGITTKLNWDINDQHAATLGYWYERARQRQTQPYIPLNSDNSPSTLWADDASNLLTDANGKVIQGRNQYTVTPAQKVWVQDTWTVNPNLTLVGGLAYQYVERQGNNLGALGVAAEKRQATYKEWLPNFSAKYQLNNENQLFYNISKNMRTPQNYVLYNSGDSINLNPEISWNNELGYRFQTKDMLLSATLFYLTYKDRQLSSRTIDGDYEMINVGSVETKGLELEWSGNLPYNFNYYLSYSYTDAKQKDNISAYGVSLPTEGKLVPGTSKNAVTATLGYDDGRFYSNFTGRYLSSFYGDMTNNEEIGGRTVFDLAAGYRFPLNTKSVSDVTLKFGVNNVFDKEYIAAISSPITAGKINYTNASGASRTQTNTAYYTIGEDRTYVVSLSAKF